MQKEVQKIMAKWNSYTEKRGTLAFNFLATKGSLETASVSQNWHIFSGIVLVSSFLITYTNMISSSLNV